MGLYGYTGIRSETAAQLTGRDSATAALEMRIGCWLTVRKLQLLNGFSSTVTTDWGKSSIGYDNAENFLFTPVVLGVA